MRFEARSHMHHFARFSSFELIVFLIQERRATWAGGNPGPGPGGVGGRAFLDPMFSRLEIPHTFMIHSYKRPTGLFMCVFSQFS